MDLSVHNFAAALASSSPAPGGGAAAALVGALAAGLGCMVCRLTVDNPKYSDARETLSAAAVLLSQAQMALMDLAEKDTEAFNQVMAAYKLPKATEDEKSHRNGQLQKAFTHAAEVPLQTAETVIRVSEILIQVVQHGNNNAVSDCGVAIESARTALRGALMNVAVNVPEIKNTAQAETFEKKLTVLKQQSDFFYDSAMTLLKEKFPH
jgi:formiminotetrahydrofolate cyclodeaminase